MARCRHSIEQKLSALQMMEDTVHQGTENSDRT